MPDKFDGTGFCENYIKLSEVIAQYNRYTDLEKAALLVSSLQGCAKLIYEYMSSQEIKDYCKVK